MGIKTIRTINELLCFKTQKSRKKISACKSYYWTFETAPIAVGFYPMYQNP